jgi:hypothetical protein
MLSIFYCLFTFHVPKIRNGLLKKWFRRGYLKLDAIIHVLVLRGLFHAIPYLRTKPEDTCRGSYLFHDYIGTRNHAHILISRLDPVVPTMQMSVPNLNHSAEERAY